MQQLIYKINVCCANVAMVIFVDELKLFNILT